MKIVTKIESVVLDRNGKEVKRFCRFFERNNMIPLDTLNISYRIHLLPPDAENEVNPSIEYSMANVTTPAEELDKLFPTVKQKI
jgi:hypothetical protein